MNEAHVGVADDFDGFFQRLVLNPGDYEIEVRLDGYETLQAKVFLGPGGTYKIHHQMTRVPAN